MNALSKRLHPARIRRSLGAATCVESPIAFVFNELRGIPTEARYRLRHSGLTVGVRHPLLDMWVLEEVFRFGAYQPPPEVSRALAALARPLRILDLGGHAGYFALYMRQRYPNAEITSFEPDPHNAAVLSRSIAANGLEDRWKLIPACGATSDGVSTFTSNFHLSRVGQMTDPALGALHAGISSTFPFLKGTSLLEPQTRQVQRQDVFPFLEASDLVKIDIEGAEWEILADARFHRLASRALVLEYHPAYTPEPDPHQLVALALERGGYRVGRRRAGPDGVTIWAWKEPGPPD